MMRALTYDEIDALVARGCTAEDWAKVTTEGDGLPDALRVCFIGRAELGEGCVVRDCMLENVSVGKWAVVNRCGYVGCSPEARFGIGTRVNVLDETGGKAIYIRPTMSWHEAWAEANATHSIDAPRRESTCDLMHIGDGAQVQHVPTIEDVNIGAEVKVTGALCLRDGTIGQGAEVCEGVVCEHFIVESEATVGVGCMLRNVFVGQASRLDLGFTARNSFIASNCLFECGEADAMFAGPHSVSCHKSTLLIGIAMSFFNAGSGTNQSNHLYGIGPVHHGLLGRGAKTGSGSYIKWPARFGMHNIIVGQHTGHPDTWLLPYSLCFGQGEKTVVVPGAVIKSYGLQRDLEKWPKRDKRSANLPRYDVIDYSPWSAEHEQLVRQGLALLQSGETPKGCEISDKHRKEGIELYELLLAANHGDAQAQGKIDALREASKQKEQAML